MTRPGLPTTRRSFLEPGYVASITDELVPALQKRQLTRTDYTGGRPREMLRAF